MDDETTKVVNELFLALIAINPAFKQAWPTEHEYRATKRQWILAFMEAGISSLEEVKKGLKTVRHSSNPFIPSPGEFISMCRLSPEDVGAPSAEKAYNEVLKKCGAAYGPDKSWSHPLVGMVKTLFTSYEISHGTKEDVFPRFEIKYLQLCSDFGSGKIMNQIEEHKPQPKSVSSITGM